MRALRPVLALLLLCVGSDARSEDELPGPAPNTTLRATQQVYLGHSSGPSSAVNPTQWLLGVTVARQLTDRLALEATAGLAGAQHVGPNVGAASRLRLLGTSRSAATAALGVQVGHFRPYRTVALGHLEVAWQLRRATGVDLVLGGGLATPLLRSGRGTACGGPLPEDRECEDRFRFGQVKPWVNVQAGWAF
ncbi:MAG TPA: hypothetical protein VEB43_05585 [Anaeromyxobacter sp.]|nr:hypothetical protein [Anaeromyxobacter sp.]